MASLIPHVVEIIIAGGGAAGCVVAARLARAYPSLSILLIEAGIDNKDHPQVINPALFPSHLVSTSTTTRFYKSLPSKELGGRELVVATGDILGGGSSINFQAYVRPSRSDFDDWATEGWGSEDLVPLLKKLETYHVPHVNKGQASVHGFAGEFHISQGGLYPQEEPMGDLLRATKSLGYEITTDTEDLATSNAFGPLASWIHPQTGRRQDAAHVLIHPLLASQTTNLRVLTSQEVIRVIFDANKRATGVEVQARNSPDAAPIVINAKLQVVLSAGAFGSSLILERSGIGRADILERIQIPVVYTNPNVGSNYQDHPVILYTYVSSAPPETTLDCILSGRLNVQEALSNGSNKLTSNHIEGTGKIRPSEAELKACSKHFNEVWNRDFKEQVDKPLCNIMMPSGFLGDPSLVPAGQYLTLATMASHPLSRGWVHATGKSVDDAPEFEAGLLAERMDLEVMVWGYKKQREIARRMDCYRGPVLLTHPTFAGGSKASFAIADRDVGKVPKEDLKNVEYSDEDEQAIVDFVRSAAGPTWHSLGTCPMKTKENGGVVDGKLNVYGVAGLKIADLSIVPKMVGANTYSTALVVGEKAAEVVIEELRGLLAV